LSLPQGVTERYILFASVYCSSGLPQRAGTGRAFIPLILAPRFKKGQPAGGGDGWLGCIVR
jgi:hypothetical protein